VSTALERRHHPIPSVIALIGFEAVTAAGCVRNGRRTT
jgi:hypothetical protein